MKRKHSFLMTAAVLAAFTMLFNSCRQSEPAQKPNVILIITDDQGYGDIAFHGNAWIKTPHMDQLAQESFRLTDFHVGTTCAPTLS